MFEIILSIHILISLLNYVMLCLNKKKFLISTQKSATKFESDKSLKFGYVSAPNGNELEHPFKC